MGETENITAQTREKAYRFFAGLFLKPPSAFMVDMIKDGSILTLFQGGEEPGPGLAILSEFVGQAPELSNLGEELEAEHTALFVLPSGVLPHEAVYLDKQKRLGGSVTAGVRRFYEEAGATILDECIEMPDHIGMELEFMGFLCSVERQLREGEDGPAIDGCLALQAAFLEGHLMKWAPSCCDEIIKHTTHGFYKAAALLLVDFLKGEAEYAGELRAPANREEKMPCETLV